LELKILNVSQCRALYEAGYQNLCLLSHAKPYNLLRSLQNSLDWNSVFQAPKSEKCEIKNIVPISMRDIEKIQNEANKLWRKKGIVNKKIWKKSLKIDRHVNSRK